MNERSDKASEIQQMQSAVSEALVTLQEYFKPEAKLTFIMRLPGHDEAETLITDDSLDELAALIQRMKTRDQ